MEEIVKLGKQGSIKVDKPNICPHCQKGIDSKIISVIGDDFHNQSVLYIAFKCPICQNVFFGKYFLDDIPFVEFHNYAFYPSEIIGGHSIKKSFPTTITELSSDFVKIYNDAYGAEQQGLESVVGIGYRLAFEHLIKDFCVSIMPDERVSILKKSLSSCIQDYLDEDIKQITNRAAWLGNDFAHYESKHPDFNVNDLKVIIDICVSKLDARIMEKQYIEKIEKK